jgi:hypothetical protein
MERAQMLARDRERIPRCQLRRLASGIGIELRAGASGEFRRSPLGGQHSVK